MVIATDTAVKIGLVEGNVIICPIKQEFEIVTHPLSQETTKFVLLLEKQLFSVFSVQGEASFVRESEYVR